MSYHQDKTFLEKTVPFILAIVCMGTCVLGINGYNEILSEFEANFLNTALASIIGIISTLLMWTAWVRLLRAIEKKLSTKALIGVITIAITVQVMITGVSSGPGVAGLAKHIVKEVHYDHEIAEAENHLSSLERYTESLKALIPELNLHEQSFKARSIDEYTNGTFTSSTGPGLIEGSQMGISTSISLLIDQIELSSNEIDIAASEAKKIIEKMRTISRSSLPSKRAMDQMAREGDKLRSLFNQIARQDQGGFIKRTLERLPYEISSRERYSKTPEVALRQKQAVLSIRNALDDTISAIGEYIDELEELRVTSIYEVNRLTSMEAIFVYFPSLISLWLASLIIDWLPFFMFLLRVIEVQFLSPNEIAKARILRQQIGDIEDAKRGQDLISDDVYKREETQDLREEQYGISQKDREDKAEKEKENADIE